MNEATVKIGKGLTDFVIKNQKTLLIIGGTIFVLWFLKKKVFGTTGTNPADLSTDYSKLTITNDQAAMIAENMYQAMSRIGTNEEVLFHSVIPLNGEDLKLVVKKFGLRRYFNFMWGEGGKIFGTDRPLQSWLQMELTKKENERMRQLFEERGVPY